MHWLTFAALALTPAAPVQADLLIVGGTESGWAATIQAVRMGVGSIVLVNDIDWLGGQFTAEGLCAIDENRARSGTSATPFPRSGLFKELMNRIEAFNRETYGLPQPGNTNVATTCRPVHMEAIFREMLAPYVSSGQVKVISRHEPVAAIRSEDGLTLQGMRFCSTEAGGAEMDVRARLTIDASDWGDAIRLSGAAYEFGPDLKAKYGEPHAPTTHDHYPIPEMNPITWCVVMLETDSEQVIAKPEGYDERSHYLTTALTQAEHKALGWPHRPHRPFAPYWAPGRQNSFYMSRRLVDSYNLKLTGSHRDALLLNWTTQNYPLDRLPQRVVDELEALEPGASRKNIVEMTPEQRRVVFADAKRHALGMVYHLQTTVHDRLTGEARKHTLRRFVLTDEFGTPDRLPPKPYIRESLRLKAMTMMREQETLRIGREDGFAPVMYPDGVFAWQFEYDYHPTGRGFLPSEGPAGPWEAYGKPGRGWGVYSQRANFPLRSLIPERVDGLLGAQKNLGYSSLVSSAVRLHDHGVVVGQAAGATAAVCLREKISPRQVPGDAKRLEVVRAGLCREKPGEIPVALWPYADLAPNHPAYVAVNRLVSRGALPWSPREVTFRPEEAATPDWRSEVVRLSKTSASAPEGAMTRGEFCRRWWALLEK